jgi:hypothetical protein
LVERGSSGTGPTKTDLGRARELGAQLLDLLAKDPANAGVPGATDEERAPTKALWEGLAHLALGQVALHEGSTDPPVTAKIEQAIGEFKAAGPLLQADPGSHARNQFLLGFAYAKLADFDQARSVLNGVAATQTPYAEEARKLMAQFPARRR